MKIRSITYFFNPRWPLEEEKLRQAGEFMAAARPAYQNAGYEVQTTRLATIPFPHMIPEWEAAEVVALARAAEAAIAELEIDYIALGPALPEFPESYAVIPEVLEATEKVFISGVMASAEGGVSLPAVRACAEVIHRIAPLDPNGFGNLYFAALANVPPGAPFYPGAYHSDGPPTFALATEAASLAVDAFTHAPSLQAGVEALIASIEGHAQRLSQTGEDLAGQFGMPFGGIDFSLAPFPEDASSLGAAMERIGAPAVGRHGSLAAAAILADALDKAQFPRTGFSGLLLPQLEDSVLAARAAEGVLSVNDLLLYSAVCGTGLDTIPLPGDTSIEELTAVLLDLAALAQRLEKPLTARLMPIPGKSAGDPTTFNFDFFANSRVLSLNAEPLKGHLGGDEVFKMKWRK